MGVSCADGALSTYLNVLFGSVFLNCPPKKEVRSLCPFFLVKQGEVYAFWTAVITPCTFCYAYDWVVAHGSWGLVDYLPTEIWPRLYRRLATCGDCNSSAGVIQQWGRVVPYCYLCNIPPCTRNIFCPKLSSLIIITSQYMYTVLNSTNICQLFQVRCVFSFGILSCFVNTLITCTFPIYLPNIVHNSDNLT